TGTLGIRRLLITEVISGAGETSNPGAWAPMVQKREYGGVAWIMWPEDGSLSLFSVSVGFDGEYKEINKKGIGKRGGRIVLHIRHINVTPGISIHKAIIKI